MGSCLSLLNNLGNPPTYTRRMSNVYPTPFTDYKISASDKHDDKFYFIRNEEEIDKTIEHLDEAITINEMKAEILEHTLAGLRNQKSKFGIIRSYDSADEFTPVRELMEEDEESPVTKRQHLRNTEEIILKAKRCNTTNFTEIATPRERKDIIQGKLLIEVQNGIFVHTNFIKKYGLGSPYVIIKIYHTIRSITYDPRQVVKWDELVKFGTSCSSIYLKPEWDEFFEHMISGQDKSSDYSFGFSLFYKSSSEETPTQIGVEQSFQLSSLFDQRVQFKSVDFRDPEVKGTLARVNVRFQFVHDLELIKDNLIKELKMKIERLERIRERHPVFEFEKKEREIQLSSLKRQVSKAGSELSQSSTHENEEASAYYVVEY